MRRIHFIEIEDEPWCPSSIRDAATDYLQFVIEKASPYKVALPILQNALKQINQAEIIDLCSGGGGPWRSLLPELITKHSQIKVCLTDKYPNQAAFEQINQAFPDKFAL
ncbi:MAG: hypothetical protein ABI954_11170 [Pyrinomonadaceae bacterium]